MSKTQTVGSLALAGYDDIFQSSAAKSGEIVVEMPLGELFPPEFHPFNVFDDLSMYRLADKIKQYGVLEGGFEWPDRKHIKR